jgi:FkbM family methyltransferase
MIRAGFWEKVRARGLAGIVKAAYRIVKAAYRRIAFDNPNSYLKRVTGIIHVGANLGQERELYAKYKLKVLWIEPLPHIFEKLRENIREFPDQIAVNHLITDKDDAEYLFHVADNEGMSSSILEFAQHKDIYPGVREVSQLMLKSTTINSLLRKLGASSHSYQALIMDTQGSELQVLKGATEHLSQFKFIKTEAADFESYVGCARVDDLTSYLVPFGFKLTRRDKFAESPSGGQYFDLLYRKRRDWRLRPP